MSISNPVVNKVFNDLDKYQEFCRTYGHKFNEADLYNYRSLSYKLFQKANAGKFVRSQWDIDAARFKEQKATKING